ncbi:hypothetical protein DES49_2937 [Halospina denitrificans]|uniref:Uncharacterized protein n=1 Tax=Halospina denitrificans TaxID=332522 RepID=A0A4R7JH94_9GAMM|nr:hypothetical protein [Halospina denitrificans]TDT36985.1 hypothetical protein DES49_2937 [Halospina denitrificans]
MIQGRRPEVWRKRAVNWLALIVLALVLAIFGAYLRERLAEAEAMAVRVALNNLRSQLAFEENTARARLEKGSLSDRAGANPMDWVDEPPDSYQGECGSSAAGEWGVWCFDPYRGELRYYPRFSFEEQFERAFNGEAYIWRVEVSQRGHLSLVPRGNKGNGL